MNKDRNNINESNKKTPNDAEEIHEESQGLNRPKLNREPEIRREGEEDLDEG